jgi:hypothetical protein
LAEASRLSQNLSSALHELQLRETDERWSVSARHRKRTGGIVIAWLELQDGIVIEEV